MFLYEGKDFADRDLDNNTDGTELNAAYFNTLSKNFINLMDDYKSDKPKKNYFNTLKDWARFKIPKNLKFNIKGHNELVIKKQDWQIYPKDKYDYMVTIYSKAWCVVGNQYLSRWEACIAMRYIPDLNDPSKHKYKVEANSQVNNTCKVNVDEYPDYSKALDINNEYNMETEDIKVIVSTTPDINKTNIEASITILPMPMNNVICK